MPLLELLSERDLVGARGRVDGARPERRDARAARASCPAARRPRGARARRGPGGRAVEGLRALHELLAERGIADRVIFDLGLVRELGYYTGAVFEVYDPAVGFALGGGGRYDDLLGRFGRDLPACGSRSTCRRCTWPRRPRRRLAMSAPLTIAVPRGTLFAETLDLLDRLGDRHRRGARRTTASCCSRTPAS